MAILWKRKWLIAAVAAGAMLVTYLWSARQPRIYEADCTIEYDPNPARPLGRDIEDISPPMMYWATREYFATQNRIIASRAVAERVARKLSLHHNPDFMAIPPEERAEWAGGDPIRAARILQANITVNQERDTRIVHILVRDRDPERAKVLANAVADAYLEKTTEDRLGSTSSALEWLAKQLDSLKQQLEQSELALHEFTEEQKNLSLPMEEQQQVVASEIERLSGNLTEARMKRIELAARLSEMEAANTDDPLQVHSKFVLDDDAVKSLRATLHEATREREAESTHYGDEHPKIQAIDTRIARASKQLRDEIDGLIASARHDLDEAREVEQNIKAELTRANKSGLDLNLQEITHRRLMRERNNAAKLYEAVLERTAETDLTRALKVAYVRIVDRALTPNSSIYPRYRFNLAAGGLVGLILGLALALLVSQLDRSIRTVEDAEALGVAILGVMPRIDESTGVLGPSYALRRRRRNAPRLVPSRDLVVHTHPKSSVAECCRTIRTNITFMAADHPQRAIVVASASPREGKTTVALSLAISLAQSGKRVLVVDTDLRKPRIHKALGVDNQRGVTTVLVGEDTLKEAVQDTQVPGLSLLSSGPIPPNPSELLQSRSFHDMVAELGLAYDQVVFDSPPLGAVTDAAVIAPQVDGVVLVVHAHKTTRDALRSSLRQLADVGAHITGGVLNDVDLSTRQYGYGSYYYYHSEGYDEESPGSPSRSRDLPAAES